MADGYRRLTGARLRDVRQAAGLTQRELADSARVSIGFVRDLEQGRFVRPSSELVGQVADVLNLGLAQRQALVADSGRMVAEPHGPSSETAGLHGGMARLRVNILGPLMVVRDDGVEAGLSGAPAALLGLLAMSVNQTVSRHAIVDALWGEEPPRNAIGIVHTYVSRLRSVLATSGEGPLIRDRLGYRLDVAHDQLDVLQTDELGATVLEYAVLAASGSAGWPDRVLPHLRP